MTAASYVSRAGLPVLVGLLASLVALCMAVTPVAAELLSEQFEGDEEFGHEGVVETHVENERRIPADRDPAATQSAAVTTNGKDPPRRQSDRTIDASATNTRYDARRGDSVTEGYDTRVDGLGSEGRLATITGGSDV